MYDKISNVQNNFRLRSCPICGKSLTRRLFSLNSFVFYTDESGVQDKITHVSCRNCGTLYMNPYYSEKGFSNLFSKYASFSYGSKVVHTNEQIDWLRDRGLLRDGLTLLDVGCYEGSFLRRLPKSVNCIGVDFDKTVIERGKLISGDNIVLYSGIFDSFELENEVDVITMFHVLEHLPNPLDTLRHLREISKGTKQYLVVEVPILELGSKYANDINCFFSIQHLTHFSCRTIHMILRLAGWDIVETYKVKDYGGYRLLCKPGCIANLTDFLDNSDDKNKDWEKALSIISRWYLACKHVQNKIDSLYSLKPSLIAIWGAGIHLEMLYQATTLFEIPRAKYRIFDKDLEKIGKKWRGFRIESSDYIKLIDFKHDNAFLVLSSYGSQDNMESIAKERGLSKYRIVKLYDYIRSY